MALYCFSPPVMLATFIVEVGLFLFVIVRYATGSIVGRLTALLLLCLALFQLAEFNTCTFSGTDTHVWAKMGFVSITLLMPLGLQLAATLARKKVRVLITVAYVTSFAWIVAFLFRPAFKSFSCGGNYSIFQLNAVYGGLYFAYYYGFILATVIFAYVASLKAKKPEKLSLQWIITGYAAFLVPTGVTILVKPETAVAIPSIMCGFAVIYALILIIIVRNEAKRIR